MNSWVLTDIHGCLATLNALLKELHLKAGDRLFFLGDYVDRGADSKGVIDRIWELEQTGYPVVCLGGNHELMLVEAWYEGNNHSDWYRYHGGREAVASFGTTDVRKIPKRYIQWMESLPLWHETEDYLFVHAGFNFQNEDPLWDEEAMPWIRRWYGTINYDWLGNRVILHGHTPISIERVFDMHAELDSQQVLDLDAGCVHNRPFLGHLCAFCLENRQLVYVPRVETDRVSGL